VARKQKDQSEPETSSEPEKDSIEAGNVDAAGDLEPSTDTAGVTAETSEGAVHEDAELHEPEYHEPDLHEVEHHEAEHHENELEEHGNFPAWLKVMLILLFGAAIALWGGPRIAPLLPSGLEPVARFLTPGGVRQAEEIDARLSALEQQQPAPTVSSEAIDAAVKSALADYDATIRGELTALRDTLTAVDSADIKTRLTKLETAVEGLEAQMTSLGEQLQTTVSESMERQSAMSAEQAASYKAMIDRLNAELDQLANRQGALQQEIDEVAAANARIKEEAQSVVGASQAQKAATDIAAALDTGAAFRPALDVLAGVVEDDLPTLQAVADSGVPSLAALKTEFPGLAHEALRASLRAEAEGYTGKALAFVKSQVATRSLTPQEGNSTDAILSRIEAALATGNLTECLSEAEALNDAARGPLAAWLTSVRQLSAAQAELATATAQIRRQKS
jgi:hypothetical protein